METAPSEPRIRVGPQHQVIDNPQQPDIYVRIDRGKRNLSFKECKIGKVEVEGEFVGLHTREGEFCRFAHPRVAWTRA